MMWYKELKINILCLFYAFFLCSFLACQQNDTSSNAATTEAPVLEYLHRPAQSSNRPAPTLILLHGLGSNEKDLFKMAQRMPAEWLVISARAPFPRGKDRYKWYDLKFTQTGRITNYEDIKKSRDLLQQFLNQIQKKHAVDSDRIVMGGFSQGAIMSFYMGLLHPEAVAGIACFSGDILEGLEKELRPSTQHKNLKAFVSHGQNDPTLPYSEALAAKQLLDSIGVKGTYSFDQVKHTISGQHFKDFQKWLKQF